MVLINGETSRCIDFSDRGFQYGDGVFTTIAVRDGIPSFFDLHLNRLETDSAKLNLAFPGRALLRDEACRLIKNAPNSVLKVVLTRGTGGRGYQFPNPSQPTRVLSCHPRIDYPGSCLTEGVLVRLCDMRLGRNARLAGIKHLNRLEQVLARNEWNDDEIREGILRDESDHVIEGVMSNLFLVKEDRIKTPKLEYNGVSGIMRSLAMKAAVQLGLSVEQGSVSLSELYQADELFLTNCLIKIWPVRQFEAKRYKIGAVSHRIAGIIGDWEASCSV